MIPGGQTDKAPSMGLSRPPVLSHQDAEATLVRIFQAAGFTVLPEPRIPGISYLPISPDILAFKDDQMLIVEVKVGSTKDIVAEDAQGIEIARRLFATRTASSTWRTSLHLTDTSRIQSALIMIDAKPSPSLRSFAADTNVYLLTVDPQVIQRAMKT